MRGQVTGVGPEDAKLVFIGESLGYEEEVQGEPFVGQAGRKLNAWLDHGGISRRDIRIDNTIQVRPPGNKWEALGYDQVCRWAADLGVRLAGLKPNLVVAVGGVALNAIRYGPQGFKKTKKGIELRDKITQWRGSILDCGGVKVIPILHPSSVLRSPSWEPRCLKDMERIAEESLTPAIKLPSYQRHILQSLHDVSDVFQGIVSSGAPYTFDIETVGGKGKEGRVACIGFAQDLKHAYTIPTLPSMWPRGVVWKVWTLIQGMLESRVETITQNGHFDWYWLKMLHGIYPGAGWLWDLMAMHHSIDPLEDHDLAFMGSIFTRMPYWKQEAKDPDSRKKYNSDIDALMAYNGMDVAGQIRVFKKLRPLVGEVYRTHHQPMLIPLLDLMLHGWRIDLGYRKRRERELQKEKIRLELELERVAGMRLEAKKALSTKALDTFLFELPHEKLVKVGRGKQAVMVPQRVPSLGLKPIRGKRDTSEVTIRRLTLKYPKQMGVIGPLILDHRRNCALSNFFLETRVDQDGRFRSSYGFDTGTGRLQSKKNPMGTGSNGQNPDREARELFMADQGCVLIEADLSQIEDRIVKGLTGSARLMELAKRPPWEGDVHRETGAAVFEIDQAEVSEHQRYLSKRVRHARNYGMEELTFSDTLLKDGVVMAPEECKVLLEKLSDIEPEIEDWHREVRQAILMHSTLHSACGFGIDYTHHRLNNETYKGAYAQVPQHDAACLLNSQGFVPFSAWIKANRINAAINGNVHDAILCSVVTEPRTVVDVIDTLYNLLERPREYMRPDGSRFTLPTFIEVKMGLTWGSPKVKWKRRPSKKEIRDALGML